MPHEAQSEPNAQHVTNKIHTTEMEIRTKFPKGSSKASGSANITKIFNKLLRKMIELARAGLRKD
jgi:hypothetical protein